MTTLIGTIQNFISHFLALGMMSSGPLLVTGEIRLAGLKKASQGSSKLIPKTS